MLMLRTFVPVLLLAALSQSAQATLVETSDKTFNAVLEAVGTSHSMLRQSFGTDADAVLDFSATFDADSWLATLSGSYLGMHTLLEFSGWFDSGSDSGGFTSSGHVGAASWNSSGDYQYATAVDELLLNWNAGGELLAAAAPAKKPDRHITDKKSTYKRSGDYVEVFDTGTWILTEGGVDTGKREAQTSYIKVRRPTTGTSSSVTAEWLIGHSLLLASGDYGLGTVSGRLTTVPAPAALLLALAALALGAVARRRTCSG